MRRLALANPALPGARLTEALRLGYPPAWGNPAALWALLEMPPADAQEGAVRAVTELARCRARTAAVEPPHAVTETMASLLRPHLLAAWETDDGGKMLVRAARYAQMCGPLSPQHHASTLLMCLLSRVWWAERLRRHKFMLDIDRAEAFAWSGTTDREQASVMLDASTGRDLTGYAAICDPRQADDLAHRYHLSSSTIAFGLADLLRAAMPVPMWLDELTPSAPVAP